MASDGSEDGSELQRSLLISAVSTTPSEVKYHKIIKFYYICRVSAISLVTFDPRVTKLNFFMQLKRIIRRRRNLILCRNRR